MTFSLILGSCGLNSSSELKRNASPNNSAIKLYRVLDGSVTTYTLVNGKKRFELNCDDALEKANLIAATGYPSGLITDIRYDVLAPEFTAGPSLTCHPGDRPLYKVELDGTTKYFFAASKTETELYMLGCQGLVEAMGFDLTKARTLDPYFVNEGIFTVPDSNDISCYKGVNVGAKSAWELYRDNIMEVTSGSSLDPIIYRVRRPNGSLASLSFKKEGTCDWLKVDNLDPLVMATGKVPSDFAGKSCLLTVTADAGTAAEDQKTLLLRERILPVVSSTCPSSTDLYLAYEYPDCTVSSTSGAISLEPASSPDCEGVFDFSITQKKVILAKAPADGVTCTASFKAQQDDLISAPLTLTVVKKPSIFKKPVSDNKNCQKVCAENKLGCYDGRFYHPYCAAGFCTAYYSSLSCDSTSWWGTDTYECRCLTPKGNIPAY
jgi:hypothetical protein